MKRGWGYESFLKIFELRFGYALWGKRLVLLLAQIWEFVYSGFVMGPFGKLAGTPQSTNVPRVLYIV